MSIASEITRLSGAKSDLAAAIAAKGVTVPPTTKLDGYAALVDDIVVGGGSLSTNDVNFYDYDGTLVASYSISEAQALTELPSAPDHSSDTTPLTFQEWNHTLTQVNATTGKLNIGATYIPTDGKSHLHITLTAASGLAPTLYFNKSDGSTLSVDWGDGNTDTYTNTGYFNTGAHTYASVGNYVIKIWISSGVGTYGFGNATSSTVVVGGGTAVYRQAISKCFVGANVTSIGANAFSSCYSLTSITIPSGVTSIGANAFSSCYSLTSITIPSGVTSIADFTLYNCRFLASIIIPSGVTSIGANAFQSCFPLASIIIPSGVTSIGANAFSSCYSLTSITIPSGVTSIGDTALGNCCSLTSIIIPSGVTSIAANAFYSCYAIKFYQIEATTPPTLSATSAFAGIVSICKIRVPSASLSAYQAATNWSTYANYMEGI